MLYIKDYVNRTGDIRKSDMLFVTINSPHQAAKKTTGSGWIKKVINIVGRQDQVAQLGQPYCPK